MWIGEGRKKLEPNVSSREASIDKHKHSAQEYSTARAPQKLGPEHRLRDVHFELICLSQRLDDIKLDEERGVGMRQEGGVGGWLLPRALHSY